MSATPTAAILVIGDEILSGRTKDKNIGHITEVLTARGIDVKEARIVADETPAIIEAVNALRARYTYVFSTGGIGPTHDDITADAMAAAFGVAIDIDPRAVAMMRERFRPEELNEGRLRMARIPAGADLIENRLNKVPGFRLENVYVMAGVPSIMQAMLDAVLPTLKGGVPLITETLTANTREGDIAIALADIARAHPDVMIGSYPFITAGGFNVNIALRARDSGKLAAAVADVRGLIEKVAKE